MFKYRETDGFLLEVFKPSESRFGPFLLYTVNKTAEIATESRQQHGIPSHIFSRQQLILGAQKHENTRTDEVLVWAEAAAGWKALTSPASARTPAF